MKMVGMGAASLVAMVALAASGCVSPGGAHDMHSMHNGKGMMGHGCPGAGGKAHDMSSHDMTGMKDSKVDTDHDAHGPSGMPASGMPKCPAADHHSDSPAPQH